MPTFTSSLKKVIYLSFFLLDKYAVDDKRILNMTAINTNVGALAARTSAKLADGRMQTHMRRLSTGLRVNSAADDAAGLAVANKLKSQLKGINMGIRNSGDAIALLETADAGLTTAVNIVQRMRELAVQMSNAVYTDTDRANANVEFVALEAQLEIIEANTSFNGDALLDGTFITMSMRVGDSSSEILAITIDTAEANSATSISTQALAIAVGLSLETGLNTLSNAQADVGSFINRLQFNIDAQSAAATVAEGAVGRIMDADYARETSDLAKQQILTQAATSMLAQANQSKQSVLALLQ
jgi:flagellin